MMLKGAALQVELRWELKGIENENAQALSEMGNGAYVTIYQLPCQLKDCSVTSSNIGVPDTAQTKNDFGAF